MTTALVTEFDQLVEREWTRLASPGTWWTGAERISIAAEARGAVRNATPTAVLPDTATEAAWRVAVEAATIRSVDIERWADGGLDGFAYVELVGIVSRLMAIDVAAFGLGLDERPLPDALAGEPTRQKPDGAEVTTGWVPTVGPANAPGSMSAVPAEVDAMFDVHGVLYLSLEQMSDLDIQRDGIHRTQMELAAGRTSWLNECFY